MVSDFEVMSAPKYLNFPIKTTHGGILSAPGKTITSTSYAVKTDYPLIYSTSPERLALEVHDDDHK